MSAALKAAKAACIVTLGICAMAALILGGVWAAFHYLGIVGYLIFVVGVLFAVAWCLAMADIRSRGEQ